MTFLLANFSCGLKGLKDTRGEISNRKSRVSRKAVSLWNSHEGTMGQIFGLSVVRLQSSITMETLIKIKRRTNG